MKKSDMPILTPEQLLEAKTQIRIQDFWKDIEAVYEKHGLMIGVRVTKEIDPRNGIVAERVILEPVETPKDQMTIPLDEVRKMIEAEAARNIPNNGSKNKKAAQAVVND